MIRGEMMDTLRAYLAPLTDWMPPALRNLLDVEVWWLIFLALALLVLLLLGLMLRRLWRALFRRDPLRDWERERREDLEACPLPTRPPGDQILYAYHLPVRLRLVIVAPPGKEGNVDATAVEKLLDRVVPGLGAMAARDRPRIRVWPQQLSQQGFVTTFHRCTLKREPEGEPSRWVLLAGRALLGRQPLLLGLGLWTEEPCTIGRGQLEPPQWLDVLRLRPARE
jgi:hypothetical protein